jgi:VCBS repeat-containing protein
MNDMWSFNTTTSNWTHVCGPTTLGDAGTRTAHGSAGSPAARAAGSGWVTADGDLWLIGGFKGRKGSYNDVWIYNIGTNIWTWKLGSSNLDVVGTYGTLGVAAPDNVPGSRFSPSAWVTLNGAIWVLGGGGFDGFGSGGRLSDLWRYGIAVPSGAPPEPAPAPFPDELIVNRAPNAEDATAGTMAYVPVAGQLTGSDADGDKITFTTLSQGTLNLQPNGQWTYTPAPGFTGTATFQFRAADAYGGTSAVRTLVVTVTTNPADADNDGIPDTYEQGTFGSTGADALGDADGDGQNNYFEYLAGTNPVDAAQTLTTAPSIAAGASANGGSFKLDLSHVRPGVNYHLETSSDLDVWNRIGTFTFSVSGSATIEDPTAPTGQPAFYRISLEAPALLP